MRCRRPRRASPRARSSANAALSRPRPYTSLPDPGTSSRAASRSTTSTATPCSSSTASATAWRALAAGVCPGRDVAALNANLRALGYGQRSRPATTFASRHRVGGRRRSRWPMGSPWTGSLLLGSVVFAPGAGAGGDRNADRGAAVQPGPVLVDDLDRARVTIALDAASADPREGRRPGPRSRSRTTRARRREGLVRRHRRDGARGQRQRRRFGSPTIEVDVTPHRSRRDRQPRPGARECLDHDGAARATSWPFRSTRCWRSRTAATRSRSSRADGTRRLVAVSLGLFDDADGLVQVSGSGSRAGQRVVVPGS